MNESEIKKLWKQVSTEDSPTLWRSLQTHLLSCANVCLHNTELSNDFFFLADIAYFRFEMAL